MNTYEIVTRDGTVQIQADYFVAEADGMLRLCLDHEGYDERAVYAAAAGYWLSVRQVSCAGS